MQEQKKNEPLPSNGATVGYKAVLWTMADAVRGSMDAVECKHVCVGLRFLKYVSDEYRVRGVSCLPREARWPHRNAQVPQSTGGQLADDAMAGIERTNSALKGVLPKDYPRPALDKVRLGQLIDMTSNIKVGNEASRAKDVLGRVRDPCCGSSGKFVPSVEFIRTHASGNGGEAAHPTKGGTRPDISIYSQESLYTTVHLAKMNLSVRGLEGNARHGGNVESVA